MLRSLFVVGMFAMATTLQADDTKLQKSIRIASNIGYSINVSDDQQVATVHFDNAVVEVNGVPASASGVTGQTDVQTRTFTLRVPYATEARSVTMVMDVRGYHDVDPSANARLVACVGSVTQSVDLSKKNVSAEEDSAADAVGDDFEDRVTFTLQTRAANPVAQITFLLSVDRDTDVEGAGSGLLVLDSLNIEVAKECTATLAK